jgi:uncharacterized membrane protein YkoI
MLVTSALAVWLMNSGLGMADEGHQAKIDTQEVTRIVQTQYPDARISEIELETEDGRLVYEVELVTKDGQKKELHVNAMSGKIEKTEPDWH